MFILAMRRRGKRVIALCLASFVLTFIDARAESITLTPVADTVLFEARRQFESGVALRLPPHSKTLSACRRFMGSFLSLLRTHWDHEPRLVAADVSRL